MTHRILLLAVLAAGLFVAGCKKDKDTEQENISKIVVHLTGSSGYSQEFVWQDPDGGDASNATSEQIVIPAGVTDIHSQIHVYDGTKTPQEDLTEEIEEEGREHLLTYTLNGLAVAKIDYDDLDSDGKPVGIETDWTIGSGNGTVRIRLYHQPTNKDDLVNPGGEIDFDVAFAVLIQ